MTTIQDVGQHVKRLRTEKGISVREMARRCGISPNTVQYTECGKYAPRLDILLRMLHELNAEMQIESLD